MIKTQITVKDIDYDSLLRFMVPMLESSLSGQSNPILRMAAKLIGKDGEPTGLASFFVSVMPKKDEMVVSLLPHFDEALISNLNTLLSDNKISARVDKIKSKVIDKGLGAGLSFTLVLNNIDYERTVTGILPATLQKLSQNSDRLAKLLSGREALVLSMINAAIGAVPVKERDALVASVMREYRNELIKLLDHILLENKIRAKISQIDVY